MADNFNRWYKRKFEKLSGDPPDEIWESIANTLDSENDRRRRRGFLIRIFSLAGLLFIGSIIAINYTFNNEKESLAYEFKVTQKINTASEISSDEKIESPDQSDNIFENNENRIQLTKPSKDKNSFYGAKVVSSVNDENLYKSHHNLKSTSIIDKSPDKTLSSNHEHLNITITGELDKPTADKKENQIKESDDKDVLKNNLSIINNSSGNLITTSDADTSISNYSQTNLSTNFYIHNGKVYSENNFITESNYQLLDTINNESEVALNKTIISASEDSSEKKDTVARIPTFESDSALSETPKNKTIKGLYIGSTYTLNNIWLMNHDTYNGLKSSELNRTQISFGSAYGIVIGYNLSDRYSLQAEWLMNINQGQKYYVYTEGIQFEKRLRLDYTQANLLIKRKSMYFNSGGDVKGTWNKIAGAYVGYLKSAIEKTDFYESNIKKNYNTFNYGIILGLEYEAYVNNRWMISSGLMTNIGLKNIYKGTFKEPGDFNKTSVFNLGINFGLKYLISSN